MPITYGSVSPGDTVDFTGTPAVAGYVSGPGTVQPDWGDGTVRILWADGFALSVLPADHPLLVQLGLATP